MKNYSVNPSEYIGDAIFNTKVRYTEFQNQTKIIYFDYLNKGKSVEEFSKQVYKLWGNIDHSFMDKQINKLQNILHNNNVKTAIDIGRLVGIDDTIPSSEFTIDSEFFKLIPESEFQKVEKTYMDHVIGSYKEASKIVNKPSVSEEEYLDYKLDIYDEEINQVVAYFNKDGGIQRYVQLSSYLSMLHNVDLTRSGWNQTMADAEYLQAETFIIPYHPFSCEYCIQYQNRPLSKYEVENIIGVDAEEQIGDILHPNCKCTLSIYWNRNQIQKEDYNLIEKHEQYETRQKVNSYTLTKNKLEIDRDIANKLGFQDKVDEITRKINKINKKISKMVNSLPTASLKKQVVAINR